MIKANIPVDVLSFLRVMMNLSSFDFIPSDPLNNFLFSFSSPLPISDEQKRTGYSHNFILSTGSMFWYLVIYGFVAFLLRILFRVSRRLREVEMLRKLN